MEPRETNGLDHYKVIATGDTNAALLRGSRAKLYGYDLFCLAAYDVYIHFYDQATSPTVGTNMPLFTIAVPTLTDRSISFPSGITFKNGLAISITKFLEDTDTTSLVAKDVVGMIAFK